MEIEAIVGSTSALISDYNAPLDSLHNTVSNAVDHAVQLAQRIGAHISDLRASKDPLRLADIDKFLVEVTDDLDKSTGGSPWDLIGSFIQRVGTELGALLPKVKDAAKASQLVSSEQL